MSGKQEVETKHLTSKDSDYFLHRAEEDWMMAWLDTPLKGMTLAVEYIPENLPIISVYIEPTAVFLDDTLKTSIGFGFELEKMPDNDPEACRKATKEAGDRLVFCVPKRGK